VFDHVQYRRLERAYVWKRSWQNTNTHDAGFIDILGRTFHLEEVRSGYYCEYGSLTRSLKAARALFAAESTGEGGGTSLAEAMEPFYSRSVSTKGHDEG